jgi:Fic family protein
MSLFLVERRVLSAPLLYLSAYLEANRSRYYDVLMKGRLTGDLVPWLLHFLTAVETQARDAAERADRLTSLQTEYRRRLGRSRSAVAHALVNEILSSVYVTIPLVAKRTRVTYPAAKAAVEDLVRAGILRDAGLDDRPRAYYAWEVLEVIAPEESPAPRETSEVS